MRKHSLPTRNLPPCTTPPPHCLYPPPAPTTLPPHRHNTPSYLNYPPTLSYPLPMHRDTHISLSFKPSYTPFPFLYTPHPPQHPLPLKLPIYFFIFPSYAHTNTHTSLSFKPSYTSFHRPSAPSYTYKIPFHQKHLPTLSESFPMHIQTHTPLSSLLILFPFPSTLPTPSTTPPHTYNTSLHF